MKTKMGKAELIFHFLKGNTHYFVLVFLFSMFSTLFNALTPQIISYTVDDIIDKGINGYLFYAGIAVLVSAALGGICQYLNKMYIAKGAENFVKAIRDELFSHIQNLPYEWHMENKTGEIIQRCTSDVETVKQFVCNQLMQVLHIVFLIVVYMGIMFTINVKISIIAVIIFAIVIFYSWFFHTKIADRFEKADEAEGELSAVIQENLTGVRVVRAFGRERYEIDRFNEKNDRFSGLWIRLGELLSAYWATGDVITNIQVLLVICFGVIAVVNGELTLGKYMALISYNGALIWPIRNLGRIIADMSKAGVSMDRLIYILDAEEESDAKTADSKTSDGKTSDGKTTETENVNFLGDIRFENVNFTYDGEHEVLKDINMNIKGGSTFAILGGTGSGKSTMMHLIDRLYDLEDGQGTITIDGVDIRNINRKKLRKNVGIVLQEPFLFSRTIEENIAITKSDLSSEETKAEIKRSAEIACVDEAIDSFQNGYQTVVGERGVTLSGGQKQRVAIARMLMQNAPIMIFDDSLSAVDTETDAKIRHAIRERLNGSTVILISHRVTTLMQADTIVVLDKGKIAQVGSHEELIETDGLYKEIYELQMKKEEV